MSIEIAPILEKLEFVDNGVDDKTGINWYIYQCDYSLDEVDEIFERYVMESIPKEWRNMKILTSIFDSEGTVTISLPHPI